MLPKLAELLDGFELYARAHGAAPTCDERAIAAALGEAVRLAADRERDEPAALFFALAQTPRAFAKLHGEVLQLTTLEHAHAVGLELRCEPVELQIHRLRIVRQEMTFLELRGWFAARLHPLKRRPWPPG